MPVGDMAPTYVVMIPFSLIIMHFSVIVSCLFVFVYHKVWNPLKVGGEKSWDGSFVIFSV
jgi:hypothetical protein